MKHKRQRHAQKVMLFFEKHFGVVPPYNIMVDATFVKEALKNKVNIWDQLPKYLGGAVRMYTTRCALKELEAFGKLLYGPLKVMRQYKIAPCPHQEYGVDPVDCLRKTVKRSHADYIGKETEEEQMKKSTELKFFIATQHRDLAVKAGRIPGVPVLYLHGNAIILEKITEESKQAAGIIAHQRLVPSHEMGLKTLYEKEGLKMEEDGPIHHRKKLKGPNPLSVLKKRRGLAALSRLEKIRERRKWRRVRKRKGGKLTPLEELMMRELLIEDQLGWKGIIYKRKPIAELKKETGGEG